MEKKLNLVWEIYNTEMAREERYCHNCGKKAIFEDSMKRRQNANGKNIYHYAIYKCPKGHTWNKSIESFKAVPGLENKAMEESHQQSNAPELTLAELHKEGIQILEISLNTLQERVRVDKLLAEKLMDLSRGEIVRLIVDGRICVNGEAIKPKASLKERDVITFKLVP